MTISSMPKSSPFEGGYPYLHRQETAYLLADSFREDSLLDISREKRADIRMKTKEQVQIQSPTSNELLSNLPRLKISHSDECPCSTGPQTTNHILQPYPIFDALRRQTWPSLVNAHRKLLEPVKTLRQTADFVLLNGLKI